jgi:hypothetical protein
MNRQIFDPTDGIWIKIILYASIFLEIVAAMIVLLMLIGGRLFFLELLIAIGSIVLFHITVMVSLNLISNVQSIKENMSKQRLISMDILEELKALKKSASKNE